MAWKVKIPATITIEIPNADDEDSAKFQADEFIGDHYTWNDGKPEDGKAGWIKYNIEKATVKECDPTFL